MHKTGKGRGQIKFERRMTLRTAIQRTFTPPARPVRRVGAGLIALGLAAPGASPLAAPFPAEIELSSLQVANGGDSSAGFVLNGISDADYSGVSVSAAGDVNGDGIDDLIIGASRIGGDPPGDLPNAGTSYVVFGRVSSDPFPAEFELSSLLTANGGDGSTGFVLHGIYDSDRLGYSVSAAGDVNGDSIDDLIIGAYKASPSGRLKAGEVYVVLGRASDEPFPAEFELSSLSAANSGDGSEGFVLKGTDQRDYAGKSVAAAGDVNGDGLADLIIGANRTDPGGRSNTGTSYVVFGRGFQDDPFPAEIELSSLLAVNSGDGSTGFVLQGVDSFDNSGVSVSGAGDVNGDGMADIVIGAFGGDCAGLGLVCGESYVIFGMAGNSFPADIELSSLLTTNGGDGKSGFVLHGIDRYDNSGLVVSSLGDFDGDGIDDLLVASPDADPGGRSEAGESYVVFGRDSNEAFPAEINLSSLLPANGGDGSEGIVLNGIDGGDGSGRSTKEAGDINGDGMADLLIGAWQGDPGARSSAGESYVVFGRSSDDSFPALIELANLLTMNGGDGSRGFVLNGIDAGDRSGRSVSAAGDVNGDGVDDVIVGAFKAAPGGQAYAGESYVVFGRADTDGDDIADNLDNCPQTPNPDQADDDGAGDLCDNCTMVANPTQCDTDADGFGNRCDADLNNDGGVTQADLGLFRSQFGATGNDLDADFDCDSGVTQTDLGIFRSLFNKPPGPSAFGP